MNAVHANILKIPALSEQQNSFSYGQYSSGLLTVHPCIKQPSGSGKRHWLTYFVSRALVLLRVDPQPVRQGVWRSLDGVVRFLCECDGKGTHRSFLPIEKPTLVCLVDLSLLSRV